MEGSCTHTQTHISSQTDSTDTLLMYTVAGLNISKFRKLNLNKGGLLLVPILDPLYVELLLVTPKIKKEFEA